MASRYWLWVIISKFWGFPELVDLSENPAQFGYVTSGFRPTESPNRLVDMTLIPGMRYQRQQSIPEFVIGHSARMVQLYLPVVSDYNQSWRCVGAIINEVLSRDGHRHIRKTRQVSLTHRVDILHLRRGACLRSISCISIQLGRTDNRQLVSELL